MSTTQNESMALEAIDRLGASMAAALEDHGPAVAEATLLAARMEATSYVFVGLFWIAMAVAAVFLLRFMLKNSAEIHRTSEERAVGLWTFVVVFNIVAAFGVLGSLIANPFIPAVVGVFSPDAWLAYRVLVQVLGVID